MKNLRKKQPQLSLEQVIEQGDRLLDIEQALDSIARDYDTHDMLFERFESKGFVLALPSGGYRLVERGTDPEPPYYSLADQLRPAQICLVSLPSRENNLFLGRITHLGEFEVYTPIKILKTTGEDQESLKPERFASYALSQMNIKLTLNPDINDLPKERNWKQTPKEKYFGKSEFEAPLKGEDLLPFYRDAVLQAVKVMKFVNREIPYMDKVAGITRDLSGSDVNFLLFENLHFNRYILKIREKRIEPIDMVYQDQTLVKLRLIS